MNPQHSLAPLAAALLLALAAPGARAQDAQLKPQAERLKPQAERITDEAISADQRAYESLQGRIKALNDGGRPVRDYHLSKAQCWLDVSFHEYTRNDRSAFPQAAMTESEKLVGGMEARQSPLPFDTPLVNGAARLRPDLWDRAAALRGHAGFRCAQQKAACAEVELVHAGNEHQQQQWRHAKPYVQIAEDLLAEAESQAASCNPPPPPSPPRVAPPPAPVPVPVPTPEAPKAAPQAPVQELNLSAAVLFNFDRHDAKNMRPFSVVQLEELVRRVQRDKLVVESVRLAGHADRLNGTGHGDYNQRLSEKRVATVKAELVRLGLDGKLVVTAAAGDTQQVSGCEARFPRPAELQECLLPNRRVEVTISARRP